MRNYYLLAFLMCLLATFTLTGCASYDSVQEDIVSDYSGEVGGSDQGLYEGMTATQSYFYAAIVTGYTYLRSFLVLGILSSILFGIFLRLTVKKSKKVRKAAVFTFMIGIPLFLVIIFYILAFYLNRFE